MIDASRGSVAKIGALGITNTVFSGQGRTAIGSYRLKPDCPLSDAAPENLDSFCFWPAPGATRTGSSFVFTSRYRFCQTSDESLVSSSLFVSPFVAPWTYLAHSFDVTGRAGHREPHRFLMIELYFSTKVLDFNVAYDR